MKTKEEILAKLETSDIEHAIASTCSGFVVLEFAYNLALFGDDCFSRPPGGDRVHTFTRDDMKAELARRAAKPEPVEEKREPKRGDWWRDVEDGDIYIIAQTSLDLYAAVCVSDGCRWAEPKHDARGVFNFDDALFAFYASSLDEFVAKRAAEMGLVNDKSAMRRGLEQAEAELDALRAENEKLRTQNIRIGRQNDDARKLLVGHGCMAPNEEIAYGVNRLASRCVADDSKRDIAWAAKMLADGKKVRCKWWSAGEHWTVRNEVIASETGEQGCPASVRISDIISSEWELYADAPAQETFGWDEALRRMKDGKCVTRAAWGCDTYCAAIVAANGTVVWHPESVAFRFKVADFDATDWREVPT